MKERSKRETLAQEQSGNGLIGGRNNIVQLEDEISHYRERYHLEKQTAETKKKELDAMETKGQTLKRTLLHDDSKLLQAQVLIEKEREKMQQHVQTRFWFLSQAEDA